MTRKRFIKLLMGRGGLTRNETAVDVSIVQSRQKEFELVNRRAKAAGFPARLKSGGYSRAWRYYERIIENEKL